MNNPDQKTAVGYLGDMRWLDEIMDSLNASDASISLSIGNSSFSE